MPSITTRRSGHVEQRRAEFQARILSAVERLLAGGERFTDLGVQRIIDEAGVARSTFYMHFRDKTDVMLRLAEKLKTSAYGEVTDWDPEGTDPFEAMVASVTAVIRMYREQAHLLRAVLEAAAYDEAVRNFWNAQLEPFVTRGRELIEAAQRDGTTPSTVRVDTAVRLLTYGGMQAITHHITHGDPEDDDDVAREIAEIQWFGVFQRPFRRDEKRQP